MIIIIPLTIIALALIAILAVARMIITRFPSRLGLKPVGPLGTPRQGAPRRADLRPS